MTAEEFKKTLILGEHAFDPGTSGTIKLPVGHLITHEVIDLTVHVRRGKRPGPRLLVTAGVHGDELNGIEAIRMLMKRKMRTLSGDLILIPIVNLSAFLARSRYMPDRRDLNRLFPGSTTGSFGARLAKLLGTIAKQCTHGIDLHTGAVTRPNLPQIRFTGDVPGSSEMAMAFGAPAMIESAVRSGSFRHSFSSRNRPQLLFEAGEAGTLEPAPVRIATNGVVAVMRHLQMLPPSKKTEPRNDSILCVDTWWQRASCGGLFLPSVDLGKVVSKGAVLGKIGNPLGHEDYPIYADREGVIIGRAKNGVIDEGDGIFHLGLTDTLDSVSNTIEAAEADLDHRLDHPVFDDALED